MNQAVKLVLTVWAVLMLSTAASTWGFSNSAVSPVVSTVAVMIIAAIKVGLVLAFFMELRISPRPWQLLGVVWVVATASMIVSIYLR